MIPKQFKVFGQTIKVKFDKNLLRDENNLGVWLCNENKIILQPSTKKKPIKQENIEQIFYHELVHCILDKIGREDLSLKEDLVDLIGQVLHQVIKTKK
jgi:predicted SprT family Zn-dependent metalloprotease